MNYRAKNIGIAVALAALAAILTSVYVVNYKRHVQHGEGKVTVPVGARNILVLQAPSGSSQAKVTNPGSGGLSVQLRLTDAQTQKLLWIEKYGAGNGAFHLALRPPSKALDSSNTVQDSRTMLYDGPGRRP